jgi:hypothetical protein
MDPAAHYLEDVIAQFVTLKKQADAAILQAADADLFRPLDSESNSIAVLMRHIGGNLQSRFTDFLTSDGEKPDRDRDAEFEMPDGTTRETVMARWDLGFTTLFAALRGLTAADLTREIFIRGQRHTVIQALDRSVIHLAAHIGQIVMLAKHYRGSAWRTLSIPRGQSKQFVPPSRP